MVFLRTQFNYDVEEASLAAGLDSSIDPDTGEELQSATQQQFAEEVDINTIVKNFGLTGQLPENFRAPVSGDFTGVTDYQSALNAVIAADEEFMTLPADVRERFANDPQKLLEFVENDKNRDEAITLGLVPKPVEKPRDAVQAIDELAEVLKPKP